MTYKKILYKLPFNYIESLLYVLVRVALRNSIKIQEITEALKRIFLEEATALLEKESKAVTVSKLSVMTGIHRKFIPELIKTKSKSSTGNIIHNIIGIWQSNKKFTDQKTKLPKALSIEGADSDFAKLVLSVNADLNPYTILFELERIGVISKQYGKAYLQAFSYVNPQDAEHLSSVLSSDAESLFCAVEENVLQKSAVSNLHLRTEYDKVAANKLPQIKRWLLKEGSVFHARARKFLSQYDADINSKYQEHKQFTKISLTSFSFTDKGNIHEN